MMDGKRNKRGEIKRNEEKMYIQGRGTECYQRSRELTEFMIFMISQ